MNVRDAMRDTSVHLGSPCLDAKYNDQVTSVSHKLCDLCHYLPLSPYDVLNNVP